MNEYSFTSHLTHTVIGHFGEESNQNKQKENIQKTQNKRIRPR